LTDAAINNLAYLDSDSKIRIKLNLGPIGCIKSFIHYVHFCEETIPIGNDWKSITLDDFDQFRVNLNYTCRFASVSSLPPLDMTYVNDEPNLLDASDVLDESDIFTGTNDADIANIIQTTNIDSVIDVTKVPDVKIVVVDVPDVLNVTDVINISDDSYDLSSTSDNPQASHKGSAKGSPPGRYGI
jgi:hypothetical protein